MRFLPLLLLFVSFVHHSLADQGGVLDKNEVYLDFNAEFVPGSLLTVYLSFVPQPPLNSVQENTFAINIYENFAAGVGQQLHFRFVGMWNVFESTYRVLPADWTNENQEPHSAWLPPNPVTGVRPIRFDLYRIDDTTFLPFFQGFNAKHRAMPITGKLTSLHIRPALDNQATPNFKVDDVYGSHKIPNQYSPKAEMVLAALDQKIVHVDRKKKTEFAKLDKFAIGTKIRLSALMISSGVKAAEDKPENEDKNFAALLFLNKEDKLAFGFFNKYSAADKKVKLFLITGTIPEELNEAWMNDKNRQKNEVDCTGVGSSSTDIVHVLLTRDKDSKTIKLRVFYVDKPSGTECKITLPAQQEKYLDEQLTIKGVQSATLLHMNVVAF